MADQEGELLALAATLKRALAELALVSSHGCSRIGSLAQIERWTLRWIELVEEMLRTRTTGDRAVELRIALAELRAASARIQHGSRPRAAAGLPGHAAPRLAEF